MFTIVPSTFNSTLHLSKPIHPKTIADRNLVRFFDKDGFELTPLEREYYRANGIKLTYFLENLAAHKPWIKLTQQHPTVFLDHSMLLERYQFEGDAAKQLEIASTNHVELWKLLSVRRKWGIDFSVDYITYGCVTDVFHVEFDSQNLDQLYEVKEVVEKIVLNTDWVDAGEQIRSKHEQWRHYEGKEQQNWKARYFGFDTAEILCKTF